MYWSDSGFTASGSSAFSAEVCAVSGVVAVGDCSFANVLLTWFCARLVLAKASSSPAVINDVVMVRTGTDGD